MSARESIRVAFTAQVTMGKHGVLFRDFLLSEFILFFIVIHSMLHPTAEYIHLPITASVFILILLVFAVMVPASPGFIGTYHYACYKGLSVFGIPETTSISIALIMHGTGFFPVIIAGLYYLWKNKISLNELQGVEKAR